MRLTGCGAENALSFTALDCRLEPTLTVITGPNGSGKTSLARIVDIVSLALVAGRGHDDGTLTQRYGKAGRYGSRRWSVWLDVAFDDDELNLIDHWLRMALMSAAALTPDNREPQLLALLDKTADVGTHGLFAHGRFLVEFDANRAQPWQTSWRAHTGESAAPASEDRANRRTRSDAGGGRLSIPSSDEPGTRDPVGATSLEPEPNDDALGSLVLSLHTNSLTQRRDCDLIAPVNQVVRDYLLEAQQQAGFGVGPTVAIPDSVRFPTVLELTRHGSVGLSVNLSTSSTISEHPSAQPIIDLLGLDRAHLNRSVGFAAIATALITASIMVTANHRADPQTIFDVADLDSEANLGSGAGLSLALYRDKNADSLGRSRFARAQELFAALCGEQQTLDVAVDTLTQTDSGHSTTWMQLTPVVANDQGDIPLALSGAGRGEAAWLATVLARRPRCLVLDEPATNLSATAQQLLTATISARTAGGLQTVLITHSAHLVRADTAEDLAAITRLSRSAGRTVAHRIEDPESLFVRHVRRLRPAAVREGLFSAGVLLVEGATEVELLRVWLSRDVSPTVLDANVSLISINGDQELRQYMGLYDQLGVPWAAVIDGPALSRRPAGYGFDDSFEAARTYWAQQGVFTLARTFGVDGSRSAEIETWMEGVDPVVFAQVSSHEARRRPDGTINRSSKPLAATGFAEQTLAPAEVVDLWGAIRARLAAGAPDSRL